MVECMMTHGLSTRIIIKRILAFIEEGYEIMRTLPPAQERRISFLKKWRRHEIAFSKTRLSMIQKFLAQINRPLMPASVLHTVDSFLLGEYLPVLSDEVGIDIDAY